MEFKDLHIIEVAVPLDPSLLKNLLYPRPLPPINLLSKLPQLINEVIFEVLYVALGLVLIFVQLPIGDMGRLQVLYYVIFKLEDQFVYQGVVKDEKGKVRFEQG